MKQQLFLLMICGWLNIPLLMAQVAVKGLVVDEQKQPIIGANVYWKETLDGTATDTEGRFEIVRNDKEQTLVVSYTGYTTEELAVTDPSQPIRVTMKGEVALDEVVVSERRAGTISSRTSVLQTQRITFDELCRAACCNLAESFETNPSVDVSYADAATGARQIKLLGLSGTYVQMLTENYPNFRGASSLYGLDYVPGSWMESIQVSKGTSSVKNGYEALAGQINVEYKKPATADPFSLNLFASDAGRYEANADGFFNLSPHLSTGLFVHYSNDSKQFDHDKDGFLDMPLKQQINLMNRWQHRVGHYVAQYGVRYLYEDRKGGQTSVKIPVADPYRVHLKTNRIEGYTKQALVFDRHEAGEEHHEGEKEQLSSIALIASGSYHDQQSLYDRTPYNVSQRNFYASLMYENEVAPRHSISAGLSLNYDGFDEMLIQQGQQKNYDRTETTPGAYAQYTFNADDKFIALAGIRADYSSLHGLFVTPRVHLKYNPFEWFHLRASAGKGFRTANVLTENNFLLSSSRRMVIADKLDQEEAWNAGLNFSFYIPLGGKDLTINAEWYHTDFLKQVVIDVDSDPHAVFFYNLGNGKSYSDSWQVEATYPFPFLRGFTLTAAYRYTDSKTDYRDAQGQVRRLKKPLISDYKGLITASYQTPLKKWQFDLTGQFNGGGRMPTADIANPMWGDSFQAHTIWNAQITKYFRRWSVYVGAENMFDFKQHHPIIGADNPRGSDFDGTMIWGPVHGRKIYAGLRFNVSRD